MLCNDEISIIISSHNVTRHIFLPKLNVGTWKSTINLSHHVQHFSGHAGSDSSSGVIQNSENSARPKSPEKNWFGIGAYPSARQSNAFVEVIATPHVA
ncbi:hypothetical protein YC2023_079680 [Brassica napus]